MFSSGNAFIEMLSFMVGKIEGSILPKNIKNKQHPNTILVLGILLVLVVNEASKYIVIANKRSAKKLNSNVLEKAAEARPLLRPKKTLKPKVSQKSMRAQILGFGITKVKTANIANIGVKKSDISRMITKLVSITEILPLMFWLLQGTHKNQTNELALRLQRYRQR